MALQSGRIVLTSKDGSLRLKELIPEDASLLWALIDFDPDHLSQYGEMIVLQYPSAEATRESIVRQTASDTFHFGIWVDDVLVGSYRLTPMLDKLTGGLSYWIGKQHTGHHYGQKATAVITEYAFTVRRLRRLTAMVKPENRASGLLLERCGFQVRASNGEYSVYELQKRQWRK